MRKARKKMPELRSRNFNGCLEPRLACLSRLQKETSSNWNVFWEDKSLQKVSCVEALCRSRVTPATMFSLLFLATGLALCVTDGQPNDETALQDMQRKVNDLWMSLLYPQLWEDIVASNRTVYASCMVKPSPKVEADKPQVTGHVLFRQAYPNGKLEAIFNLDGFPPGTNLSGRAIHIHQYGDLSDGCDSAGGHYNPFKENHPRHPGDFGNFYSKEGKIKKYKGNLVATLFGPFTIVGRSVVVHEQEDDLGKGNNKASLENGNAGRRLACCVIGTSTKNLWERQLPEVKEKRKKMLTTREASSSSHSAKP